METKSPVGQKKFGHHMGAIIFQIQKRSQHLSWKHCQKSRYNMANNIIWIWREIFGKGPLASDIHVIVSHFSIIWNRKLAKVGFNLKNTRLNPRKLQVAVFACKENAIWGKFMKFEGRFMVINLNGVIVFLDHSKPAMMPSIYTFHVETIHCVQRLFRKYWRSTMESWIITYCHVVEVSSF